MLTTTTTRLLAVSSKMGSEVGFVVIAVGQYQQLALADATTPKAKKMGFEFWSFSVVGIYGLLRAWRSVLVRLIELRAGCTWY